MLYRETVLEGIENVPAAFAGLFRGDNTGKMLVRVGDELAVNERDVRRTEEILAVDLEMADARRR